MHATLVVQVFTLRKIHASQNSRFMVTKNAVYLHIAVKRWSGWNRSTWSRRLQHQ